MVTKEMKPGLFGMQCSNRDFSLPSSWGKNQFNSAFPASVACYLASKKIDSVYLKVEPQLDILHSIISTKDLFGLDYNNTDLFFSFESDFPQYRTLTGSDIPRIDLVTMNSKTGISLMPLEIKLTALPDNATCERDESSYGSELVIRPDTIVYLALGLALRSGGRLTALKEIIADVSRTVKKWINAGDVLPHMGLLIECSEKICKLFCETQSPFILQPIWKTKGKLPIFADSCLDVFVWSDLAFAKLLIDQARAQAFTQMSRPMRSIVWFIRMLQQFVDDGRINHKEILNESNFNAQTDKAFAVNGLITNRYMRCDRLLRPSVTKYELKNIIVGGGQKFLSPERRLDAVIYYSDDLFN